MYRHCVPYVFRVDLYIRLSIFLLPCAFLFDHLAFRYNYEHDISILRLSKS